MRKLFTTTCIVIICLSFISWWIWSWHYISRAGFWMRALDLHIDDLTIILVLLFSKWFMVSVTFIATILLMFKALDRTRKWGNS